MFAGCGSAGSSGPAANSGGAGAGGSTNVGGSNAAGSGAPAGGSDATCTSSAAPGEMVDVPAGDFLMGCNSAIDMECLDDEKPMHTVSLAAFQINRTEVTQDQYAACIAAKVCNAPACSWDCSKTDYPATCLTAADAKAFCAWAGGRLPTEAEWEKAARGDAGNKFPWGNAAADCSLSNMSGCGDALKPVGSVAAGASPYGALDMAGNVVEMVSDWYDAAYYATSPGSDPQGPATGTRYGGRGGGFKSEALFQRASKRDWYDLTDTAGALGFRCAR